jgi:hypothetical protein
MNFPWSGQLAFSIAEYAAAARISRRVVYGMVKRGELRTTLQGKERRIARAEFFRKLGLLDPAPAPAADVAPAPIELPALSAYAAALQARIEARGARSARP